MGSCHGMSIYKSPGGIVSVESLVALLGPFDPPSSHRLFYIKKYVDTCILNSWSMGNGPVLPAAEFSWTGAKEVQLSVHTVSCQRQGLILKKSKREDHAELPASVSCLKKGQCWGWWSTTIVKVQASKKNGNHVILAKPGWKRVPTQSSDCGGTKIAYSPHFFEFYGGSVRSRFS